MKGERYLRRLKRSLLHCTIRWWLLSPLLWFFRRSYLSRRWWSWFRLTARKWTTCNQRMWLYCREDCSKYLCKCWRHHHQGLEHSSYLQYLLLEFHRFSPKLHMDGRVYASICSTLRVHSLTWACWVCHSWKLSTSRVFEGNPKRLGGHTKCTPKDCFCLNHMARLFRCWKPFLKLMG